ncbi:conserved exported hypothetical protein [uncultured Paludibacter sp.]|uniref:Uncharacterized protein n=1 Tax=uncultured Paludibacter sp. TaxID=497635 RepID=A0A653AJ21_9BACT|nr:conserved exported hypothetical protein [uncultured Paludibacter sp.]
MKLKIVLLFSIIGFFVSAQTIKVKTQYELPINMNAFYPTFNQDGNKLLFSSESYKGLYLYDFETKQTKEISQAQNAGYYPIFSADDSKVFFRNTNFENRLRYDALESFDVKSSKQQRMLEPQRNLRQAQSYHNGILVLTGKYLVKSTFGTTEKTVPVYVSTEDLNIYVYKNGTKTQLKPIEGNNSYIWVSLSPDNRKILFTATGKGTFICNLDGKIIASLGYLNAPVWYNDNFIVGMQDKDNGQFVTSSSVLMISVDGKIKKQISDANHIAMYPSASSKSGKIAYNTLDGKLILTEIEIK